MTASLPKSSYGRVHWPPVTRDVAWIRRIPDQLLFLWLTPKACATELKQKIGATFITFTKHQVPNLFKIGKST